MDNSTKATEFILLGLTDDPNLQVPLLLVLLFIYLITLVGNRGMMVIVLSDPHLHTPMYFFLGNLSFIDLGYSSAVAPKTVATLQSGSKVISYNGCAAQFFFFVGFATVECYLLACMAYDHHVAVCRPLHYTTTMTAGACALLTVGSYVRGFLDASIHTANTFRLSFCASHEINHFFCDIPPLLAFSCSNTRINNLAVFCVVGFSVFFVLLVILLSYLFIYIAIQRMRSAEGRKKAFSTCASHLIAVTIFYGTIIMYLQPSSSQSMDMDKIASVFYSVVIPMLNPLIYSLRNKEVKNALWKVLNKLYPKSVSVNRK
ncbi:olfactory receptor 5B21 isoform X2 [Callorhinus ursinus]|uniref:Olfactory receptor 1444 isoform X2 n=1 Tax=Callorhinus ursinus TaxID=34884 RepID=A0A3Q7R3Z9_CALUR|nr:olfactory receptor 1444 isoform X2 [Callorhinus ursinus]